MESVAEQFTAAVMAKLGMGQAQRRTSEAPKEKTVKTAVWGKHPCIYCGSPTSKRSLDIDGDSAHKKCHAEACR